MIERLNFIGVLNVKFLIRFYLEVNMVIIIEGEMSENKMSLK